MGVTRSPLGITKSILSVRHTLNPAGTALLLKLINYYNASICVRPDTRWSPAYTKARSPSSSHKHEKQFSYILHIGENCLWSRVFLSKSMMSYIWVCMLVRCAILTLCMHASLNCYRMGRSHRMRLYVCIIDIIALPQRVQGSWLDWRSGWRQMRIVHLLSEYRRGNK